MIARASELRVNKVLFELSFFRFLNLCLHFVNNSIQNKGVKKADESKQGNGVRWLVQLTRTFAKKVIIDTLTHFLSLYEYSKKEEEERFTSADRRGRQLTQRKEKESIYHSLCIEQTKKFWKSIIFSQNNFFCCLSCFLTTTMTSTRPWPVLWAEKSCHTWTPTLFRSREQFVHLSETR